MPKLNLNRIEMPRQDPIERGHNFNEVALGYSEEQALEEAGRCIQCPKRPCVGGCPVSVDIPEFIEALLEDREPVIDVYEALAMTVPGIVAHQSSRRSGEQLKVPQFDRG